MLETSTLYFARPDKFEDPFEGRFSVGNSSGISKSDAEFRQLYRMSPERDAAAYHDVHRKVVFVLCWHRNLRESRQMWDAYTKGCSESVAITTSGKALECFVPGQILRSTVMYHDLSFPRTEFDHSSLFFYKPSGYAFEREYRMLRQPGKDETFYNENPEDEFRRIPIRLNKVIHRVIAHPNATPAFKRMVAGMLKQKLPDRKLEHSALLTGSR